LEGLIILPVGDFSMMSRELANKPMTNGLRYANYLWWISRVQSDELETNTKSRS